MSREGNSDADPGHAALCKFLEKVLADFRVSHRVTAPESVSESFCILFYNYPFISHKFLTQTQFLNMIIHGTN